MFERYTDGARRVVFYALHEATEVGSPYIEAEHLLLGMLREDTQLAGWFRAAEGGIEAVRKRIEAAVPVRTKASTSADLPLSKASKQALMNAAEVADGMGQQVEIGHLALGLLKEEGSLAAQILREGGLG